MPPTAGDKLGPGDRLGHYEIISLLGQGGMGEVYRARDTTLKREVALKVLPAAFLRDGDRAGRFQREAEVLASLEHPNIGHIYGIIDAAESRALVLALIEGPTLAERIATGPLPVDEGIAIARQIVEALEYAHDRGVIHRDLKPANVKITPEGVVKVLDFGLAKVLEDEPVASSINNSPTITMGHTRAGVILGTAAYMSPEQAVGRPVDRRSDIFSFGVVLYEMLTGTQAFPGATTPDVLEAVVKTDPDWSKLPPQTPRALQSLLRRCLAKDRKGRLQAIGEARIILENPLAQSDAALEPIAGQSISANSRRHWIPWGVSAVLLLALGGAVAWDLRPSPAPSITRFALTLDPGQAFTSSRRGYLGISPDGAQIAYIANTQLYIRSMSEGEPRQIPGVPTGPLVFSPDSRWLIGYKPDALWRTPLNGGTPLEICKVSSEPLGVSWSEEGIVFSEPGKGIVRVSPNGGHPDLLIPAKSGEVFADPQMLPGGKAVLFTIAPGDEVLRADWEKAQVVAQTLKSGSLKTVVQGGSGGRYLPTGQLVYAVGGVLFAQPFDPAKLEAKGTPVGIVEGVARNVNGSVAFASSDNGSLVYVPGPAAGQALSRRPLGRVDRSVKADPQVEPHVELLNLPPGAYMRPRISRDGSRMAYEIQDGNESSIWIYELSGASATRRLTLTGSGSNRYPIWSPDGQRIAFQSDREGDLGIWWQRADGSAAPERLTKPEKAVADLPDSWSGDGQSISFTEEKGKTAEIWTYSLREKKASPFAVTRDASLTRSDFSPDSRWIAYQATNNDSTRVYLRAFPAGDTAYELPEGGHLPLWSPDGKELFYVRTQGLIGSVAVTTRPTLSFGKPAHFRSGVSTSGPTGSRQYDLLPNGQFLGVLPGTQADLRIQVVLNWFEDVRRRVSAR